MMRRSNRKPPLPKSPVRVVPLTRSAHSSPARVIKTPLANRSNVSVELRPEYYQTISNQFQALAKMVQDEFSKPIVRRTGIENSNGSLSNPCFERGRLYDEYSARRNERLKKRKRGQTEEDDKENQIVSDVEFKVESAMKSAPKRREVVNNEIVSETEFKVESAMKTASERREVVKNQTVSETEFKVESAMKTASKRREVVKNQIVSETEFKVESAMKTASKMREVAKKSVASTSVAENPAGTSRYMLRSRDKKPPLPVKYENSAVKKTVTRKARKI